MDTRSFPPILPWSVARFIPRCACDEETHLPRDHAQAALVLIGHGSSRRPEAAAATTRLAQELAGRKLFAEVAACYWKQPPFVAEALDLVFADEVYLVPNFAGEGYFTREAIPKALGLTGPVTEIERNGKKRRIHYTDPVGKHPGIAEIILRRAKGILQERKIDPNHTTLALIGHGSKKPGGSGQTARALAESIAANAPFAQVIALFLEEPPEVAHWPKWVANPNVLVEPLLIGEGLHGGEDLPPMFGLDPDDWTRRDDDALFSQAHGRDIWFFRGIGSDPEIVDVALDIIARHDEAAKRPI